MSIHSMFIKDHEHEFTSERETSLPKRMNIRIPVKKRFLLIPLNHNRLQLQVQHTVQSMTEANLASDHFTTHGHCCKQGATPSHELKNACQLPNNPAKNHTALAVRSNCTSGQLRVFRVYPHQDENSSNRT